MFTIIEKDLMRKPKLGGWRNKITGVTYANADSQTGPPPKRVPLEKTCSRKVQTVLVEDAECQSSCVRATQTWRRDCYISSVSDKYVTVGPYQSYEEMQNHPDVDGKARIIQRCYRAYRILKFVRECARVYRKIVECDRLEEEKRLARSKRYESDCNALNNPRTITDLDALVHHLETVEIPNEPTTDAENDDDTCRALKLLDARRRAFLAADARMWEARESRKQRCRERFLSRHCRPKKWLDAKGREVEMLSLRNQAAIECWQVYEALVAPVEDVEIRMEVLIKARSSIENHDCEFADVFRQRVDQEILLLAENLEPNKFYYLRKRIAGAFLQFVKTSHNCTCISIDGKGPPGIEDYEFREPLEKDRVFCTSCRKLLSRKKFPVTARKQPSNKCKACIRLHANVIGHVDLRPYVYLLTSIRDSERALRRNSSLADALSPTDLRHLVVDIWHGRSVLSERSDPRELRLPCYNHDEPWSPWNCVLLTEDETEAYCDGVDSFLADNLKRKIRLAHRTARMDFRLDGVSESFGKG